MEAKEVPPFRQLFQMLTGYWVSQALHVAAKLKLADRLQAGPRTAAELARESDAHPQAVHRLLRALVDIGGGNGSVITTVLKKYPALKGILYDLPGVVGRAQEGIARERLTGRCTPIAGSFFESAPAGGDAYMMRHIIHDWDDAKALPLTRKRGLTRPRRAG